MIKPNALKRGDKVAIVSLSSGILGEKFCEHEIPIAVNRLKDYGLEPVFMPNTLKGMDYIKAHPEKRAEDLKQAFMDDSIKCIMCAIGGDDTFRTLPYLMEDEEFIKAVKNNPKIFTGFSDSTINHLMFYKLGLTTFYGPNFIIDLAELDKEMIPYTKKYFEKYFNCDDELKIESSDLWYNERPGYGSDQIGTSRKVNKETHGYEILNGKGIVRGISLGGCIETIYEALISNRYENEYEVCSKYGIIPTLEEWQDKIMFIETSEEKPTPDHLKEMLDKFKDLGIFNQINGLIIGKPQDEAYYEEYKQVYREVLDGLNIPVIYNANFGHSTPRCILPYGLMTELNCETKEIIINESIFDKNENAN